MDLDIFLHNKAYRKIALTKNAIGHYQIKVTINGEEGIFILDTGASSSCVGIEFHEKYHLKLENSDVKATGAGASNMDTSKAKISSMSIGSVPVLIEDIVLFDLSNINEALIEHESGEIEGIIGAEILEQLGSIISYADNILYIK